LISCEPLRGPKLARAAEDLAESSFQLEAETILKCVAQILRIPPTTEGLWEMRTHNSLELRRAFEATVYDLKRTAEFLRQNLFIQSSSLVPYEGQLLLLFRTIGMNEASTEEVGKIIQWYWAAGFNESLRGKPDHYVVRAVENWRGLLNGNIRGLEPRLRLSVEDLMERRLVSGAALSSTFATMHAVNEARSLTSGVQISTAIYMTTSDLGWFHPVFTRLELSAGGFENLASSRIFGNVILMDQETITRFGAAGAKQSLLAAAARDEWETLSSQFVNRSAIDALRLGHCAAFMRCRVELMLRKAFALVGQAV
jgi:hypothetical protein